MTTRAKEISDLGITSLFTLDDNGNVGIGASSPNYTFDYVHINEVVWLEKPE